MIRLSRALIADLTVAAPTPDAVVASLQQAIELEHATIPPYLYAMYSLDAQKNPMIRSIIQGVVVEEMLHLALAANVLNALGGSPEIGASGFVPNYPTTLPGGVEGSLEVHLAPFSITQLDAFLTLESPEDPLTFPPNAALGDSITIGEFYGAILTALATLDPGVWVTPPRNQIGPDLMGSAVVVADLASARAAITTIVEQGEGTTTSPEEIVGSGLAHYYRLNQIAQGRLLVENPGPPPTFSYSGDRVVFDPSGVCAVPTDPKACDYPLGSPARAMCDAFNTEYTSLLGTLHEFCNGSANTQTFGAALGQMMSLKHQAEAMMGGVPNPAVVVGPSFEANA